MNSQYSDPSNWLRHKIDENLNSISTGIFRLDRCSTVFSIPSLTSLFLELDDSNFVQDYFGVRSIFCDKKYPDHIKNDVTMTSSLLCYVSTIAKNILS